MKVHPYIFIISIILLCGTVFSDDTAFISMEGDCRYPALTSEGNGVYMTWLARTKRPSHVNFIRSGDGGTAWSDVRQISGKDSDCMPPALAAVSGTVHCAWVDCGEVIEGELHYTRSLDSGITWKNNTVIVDNVKSATNPMICGSGNNVYLIWQDVAANVFFKASRDKGETWEDAQELGDVGKHSCYCFPPALSMKGDTLTVVWNDLSSPGKGKKRSHFKARADTSTLISSVICRISTDNGRTWSRERILMSKPVAKETIDEVDNPVFFSNGVLTWLFWQDKHDLPLGEILFTGTGTLTKTNHLAGKPLYPAPKRSPKCPSAVFDDHGNLHLVWTSKSRGMSVVHYGAIDSSGKELKEKIDLTTADAWYQNPVIARTTSGALHVCWFNKSKDKKDRSRIYLKTSGNNGLTWETRVLQPEEQ